MKMMILLLLTKRPGMVGASGMGINPARLVKHLTYYLKDLPLFQSGEIRLDWFIG